MINKFLETPTYLLEDYIGNDIYIKREDLIPFSFGGNKVRIAAKYFDDMLKNGKDCIIAYGSSSSNLCRVIANMSKSKGIPCYIVVPLSDKGEINRTFNSIISESMGAKIIHCEKDRVSETINNVFQECTIEGYKPYYIYGDKYGKGNEFVSMTAYIEAYEEIKNYEDENNVYFDYIFLASGTGTTQSGLIYGNIKNKDNKKIIGISISRSSRQGHDIIKGNLKENMNFHSKINFDNEINFVDSYVCGGYGQFNSEIKKVIDKIFYKFGVPLDTTYTGKAYWGMLDYLKKNKISKKKVLFIHTGGLPIFFDKLIYDEQISNRKFK